MIDALARQATHHPDPHPQGGKGPARESNETGETADYPLLAVRSKALTAQACRERMILGVLLVSAFAWRAQRSEQPILEGYVGRQVPTAMVARNLDRGSGFFAPQLDTGPFPNLFLVEPPVDAQIVAWISRAAGFDLDRTGRLVSAASIALACWGIHGLVRRREGEVAALIAVVALGTFPATLKYGRAFQPDALALGLSVAGLRCWDEPGRAAWRWSGWALCALAFAQKVTWSFMLVPLLLDILRDGPARRRWLAASTLLPALAWYGFVAARFAGETGGNASSVDNASNWLARLSPSSYLDIRRYVTVGGDLLIRSFTPIGIVLVAVGMRRGAHRGRTDSISLPLPRGGGRDVAGGTDRLPVRSPIHDGVEARRPWRDWTIAAALTLFVLLGKLHHDYYWLMISAPFAAWVGIAAARTSRVVAVAIGIGLVASGLIQSRSTWRTPDDWRDAPALADALRKAVPADTLVIAPEAVLYLADRRGCRLETEAGAVRRAANEWRPAVPFEGDDPAALVAFYRDRAGAGTFADLDAPSRRRFHDDVKRLPGTRVIDEAPGRYLIVALDGPTTPKAPTP